MKHIASFIGLYIFILTTIPAQSINNSASITSDCSGLGVESGWGQWMGQDAHSGLDSNGQLVIPYGPPVNPPLFDPTGHIAFYIVSGKGIDPCTPGQVQGSWAPAPAVPVVAPGFGRHSVQLGGRGYACGMAERLTYKFIPSATESDLFMANAIFLDEGNHLPGEEAFVEFLVLDSLGDTLPCSYSRVSDPLNYPQAFCNANSNCNMFTLYRPWKYHHLDLANYIGQTLAIQITNGDCVHGGHAAHSYWDFMCGAIQPEFCFGQTMDLCASDSLSGQSFQWFQNGQLMPGFDTRCITIQPVQGDTFTVVVTDTINCSYKLVYAPIDSCLGAGLDANMLLELSQLHPNPTSGQFRIEFPVQINGRMEVQIHSMHGQVIKESSAWDASKIEMDLSEFPSGVYFISLYAESGWVTKKLTISR